MFKLVAVDLDGTLLDDRKLIPSENIAAIRKIKNRGVKIVIATGRPIAVIKKSIAQLGIDSDDDYCVALNGVLVQNLRSEEVICSSGFSGELLKKLVSLSQQYSLYIHTFSKTLGLVANKRNKYSDIECYGGVVQYREFDFSTVADSDEFYKCVLTGPEDMVDQLERNLDPVFRKLFSVVRTLPCILEFLPAGVSKGRGLSMLAGKIGIAPEEMIAFGDEHNDYEMLQAVGFPVAMGNAIEPIKKISKMVTTTNNEAGVAYALDKLFAGN